MSGALPLQSYDVDLFPKNKSTLYLSSVTKSAPEMSPSVISFKFTFRNKCLNSRFKLHRKEPVMCAHQVLVSPFTTTELCKTAQSLTQVFKEDNHSNAKLELGKSSRDGTKESLSWERELRQDLSAHQTMPTEPTDTHQSFHQMPLLTSMLNSLTSRHDLWHVKWWQDTHFK